MLMGIKVTRNEVRRSLDVIVEKEDNAAARLAESSVPRACGTRIRLPNDPDGYGSCLCLTVHEFGDWWRGAVVHDEHFEAGRMVRPDRSEGVCEVRTTTVGRNDHAHHSIRVDMSH
jgi:hypothetical protein